MNYKIHISGRRELIIDRVKTKFQESSASAPASRLLEFTF